MLLCPFNSTVSSSERKSLGSNCFFGLTGRYLLCWRLDVPADVEHGGQHEGAEQDAEHDADRDGDEQPEREGVVAAETRAGPRQHPRRVTYNIAIHGATPLDPGSTHAESPTTRQYRVQGVIATTGAPFT